MSSEALLGLQFDFIPLWFYLALLEKGALFMKSMFKKSTLIALLASINVLSFSLVGFSSAPTVTELLNDVVGHYRSHTFDQMAGYPLQPTEGKYPVNANGQTLGNSADVTSRDDLPDLVFIGIYVNDTRGYVYLEDYLRYYPLLDADDSVSSEEKLQCYATAFCEYVASEAGIELDYQAAYSAINAIYLDNNGYCQWHNLTIEQRQMVLDLLPDGYSTVTFAKSALWATQSQVSGSYCIYAEDGQAVICEFYLSGLRH
jgi:hypothetical protein